MIYCPSCGAELRFDIESQQMICEHCRNGFHVEDLQDNIKALKYFYTHAYKRFEHVNEQALQFYYYKQIPSYKQYVSALEPRPNINRFLRLIKDD